MGVLFTGVFCPLGVLSNEVLVHGVLSTGSLIN